MTISSPCRTAPPSKQIAKRSGSESSASETQRRGKSFRTVCCIASAERPRLLRRRRLPTLRRRGVIPSLPASARPTAEVSTYSSATMRRIEAVHAPMATVGTAATTLLWSKCGANGSRSDSRLSGSAHYGGSASASASERSAEGAEEMRQEMIGNNSAFLFSLTVKRAVMMMPTPTGSTTLSMMATIGYEEEEEGTRMMTLCFRLRPTTPSMRGLACLRRALTLSNAKRGG